ncbi:MAG: peptide-N-glycosidase F-related protein [Bacteroidota bacterium]
MKKTILFSFMLLIMLCATKLNAQMIEHIYDFNNLTIGNLNGQDNWTTVINSNTSVTFDLVVGFNQGTGPTTPDNTLGIFYNNSGGNYGRTASRLTTPAFPFNFAIGGIMEIEADIYTAWWGTFFGFGYDANNNGIIVPGIEQQVAFESATDGGIGIYLSQQNTNNTVFMKPDGTKIHIVYDSISGWNKWKMFIDFDANGGAGAISLYAKKPGGNWIGIPTVQSLNLGLTPGSNDRKDPVKWTKVFVQALGGYSAFDNLVIRQPNTGGLLFQYLVFNNPPVNHLTTDAPFSVHPVSSRGLPVTCSITGPATITGDTLVTLTGDTGLVVITAHQVGDTAVAPAQDVSVNFNVINPLYVFPQIEIKNPVDGNIVRAPHLDPIQFSFSTAIDHSDLLSITSVNFNINSGQNIIAKPTTNGYYVGYWTPPAFGNYSLNATALSSGGVSTQRNLTFNVVPDSTAMTFKIMDTLYFANVLNQALDTTLVFPGFTGTYTKITAIVKYDCPPEGCEAWDVIGNVNIRGANGDWVELVRYITPYALACGDSIDVTDFASQLQGKIDVRANFPAKSKVSITLNYTAGTPTYKRTWMDKLWLGSYAFGTWTTGGVALQPVEVRQLNLLDTNIKAAFFRVVSTGHSGPNNTSNAAEFFSTTHHFKINGTSTFSQALWRTCNPNPTGCMPQSGTWQYSRAGWCPGSIPMLWRYDVSSRIGSNVSLMYEFDPAYVDLCSSFNPNCVTGPTCTDCANTENPRIMVAGELVTYFGGVPADMSVPIVNNNFELNISPNPSKGIFTLSSEKIFTHSVSVKVYDLKGIEVKEFEWNGENKPLDLTDFSKGVYVMKVMNSKNFEIKKLIIQ